TISAPDSTKECLRGLLGGAATPSILFTASHGVGFPVDDERQVGFQGAIVYQDWPGPSVAVGQAHYFTADDLAANAKLRGLIAFHFACYSAGTPEFDEFREALQRSASIAGISTPPEGGDDDRPGRIAKKPFVAQLPQRLLAGGALAVIGHVDRAWTSSFSWNSTGGHVRVYDNVLKLLMDGFPVGWAMERMNSYFADQAASLTPFLEDRKFLRDVDREVFADLW